ncbi:MAG: hypothetical protein H0X66_01920 [Verrucomicrobia bacterium]|nr:hypothetical protein [Verrucomicrobiota bacterium]
MSLAIISSISPSSIGKGGDVAGMELARRIGLDGLQVSLGFLANDLHPRKPEMQLRYKEAAKHVGRHTW